MILPALIRWLWRHLVSPPITTTSETNNVSLKTNPAMATAEASVDRLIVSRRRLSVRFVTFCHSRPRDYAVARLAHAQSK
jgi:hypothetical protein